MGAKPQEVDLTPNETRMVALSIRPITFEPITPPVFIGHLILFITVIPIAEVQPLHHEKFGLQGSEGSF